MNILIVYLGIFLGIIGLAFLLKFVKGAIKVFFFVSFTLLILLVVTGFFVIQDAKDFQKNFPSAPKTFLLLKDGTVVSGFTMTDLNSENIKFLENNEIKRFDSDYKNNSLNESLGNNYKLFFFNYSQFNETLENGIFYEGFELNKTLANEIFESEDAIQVLSDAYGTPRGVVESEFSSDEQIKGAFFAIMIFDEFQNNSQFLVDNLKNGKVQVYPETTLVKAVKLLPDELFTKVKKLVENEA